MVGISLNPVTPRSAELLSSRSRLKSRGSAILVLGMHRSGTSAIARLLKIFGVSFGDNLMPGSAEDNEKGFWEDRDVFRLNEEGD